MMFSMDINALLVSFVNQVLKSISPQLHSSYIHQIRSFELSEPCKVIISFKVKENRSQRLKT